MNDFDKFLEIKLRDLLDPVVGTEAPPRGSRPRRARRPILTVEVPAVELAEVTSGDAIVVPIAVTTTQL